MYGGDEVSGIVIDLGSHTCKAGYAGEDAPRLCFHYLKVIGRILGRSSMGIILEMESI